MSSTQAATSRHAGSVGPPTAQRPSRAVGTGLMVWSVAGVVSLGLLAVMFVRIAQGAGPDPWGPMNDVTGAVTYTMLAVLVPALSLPTARTVRARILVWAMVAGSLASAASGILLVTRVLDFTTSTTISVAVLALHAAWIVWLNRSWLREPWMGRGIARFGVAVGAAYFAGFAVTAAAYLVGGFSTTNVPLFAGIALGAGAWVGWPVWGFLAGRHLARDVNPQSRKGRS